VSAERSVGLVDTSILIGFESDRDADFDRLPDELLVSAVTIGELELGVLAASDVEARARRLATLRFATSLDPIPVDGPVASAWALLRVRLREEGRRMPANDSWIAATALAHDVPLITQDEDFLGTPGLTVVKL